MGRPDAIEQLLPTLYSAPLQPELWSTFLQQTSAITGISKAALIAHDLTQNRHKFLATLGPEVVESVPLYESHYFHFDQWTERFPKRCFQSKVVLGDDLWPRQCLLESNFYNEFLKPFDTCEMVGIAAGSADSFEAFSIYRGPREESFSRELVDALQLLAPHLQIALRVQAKLTGLEARLADMETALDRMSAGVVLLDAAGKCTFANQTARRILDRRDGLHLERSRLTSRSSPQSGSLAQLIRSVIALAGGREATPARAMLIRRRDGTALHVLVSPLYQQVSSIFTDAVAIVFISDPAQKSALPQEILAALFALTPAEARLTITLLDGSSLAEAAAIHGVCRETARTQIKSVFQKTGTRRQGELIRLVAGLMTPASHNT